MGWGDCGTDSQGRPIGYSFEATCDQPDCTARIDRGLSYACGGMHGNTDSGCEKYFCETHRSNWVEEEPDGKIVEVCDECASAILTDEDFIEDDDGVIRRRPINDHGAPVCPK